MLRCLLWFCGLGTGGRRQGELARGDRLRLTLQELGPIYIKFGQIISTRRDMLPEDIADALAMLQDRVEPFDSETAKQIVESELQASVEQLFASFSMQPLASASVAQVHEATLKSGESVVIKVIRPGIEQQIARDIALLRCLARLLDNNHKDARRLHLPELIDDYEQIIFNELDLKQEAANSSQLRRNFSSEALSPMMYVPDVYWDYCTEKVMTMERIHGVPVTDLETLKAKNANLALLAERGVEIFFTQVFEQNFFHADMHPGNIFIDISNPDDPSYITLDCAIMGSLTHNERYYIARILLGALDRDYHLVAKLYKQAGWLNEDVPTAAFESIVRGVCEPIFSKPIAELSFGTLLVYLFKAAGRFGMEVQPSLVLLQKTLVNIEGLGQQLYPQLDLWQTAQPFLSRWVEENYSAAGASKSLQKHLPEFIESLPVLPHLLERELQRIVADTQGKQQPALQQRIALLEQRLQRQRKLHVTLAVIAVVLALGLWHNQP